jgi:uncharacterized protein (TIGR03000 family)
MWSLLRKSMWLLAPAAVVLAFPLTASAWNNFPGGGGGGASWGGFSGRSYYGPSYYGPVSFQPYYYAVPVPYYVPTPEPYRYQTTYPAEEQPATITLRVPAAAQVFFDGDKTRQTGAVRSYLSPPLRPGPSYRYSVRVEWKEGGRARSQTRSLYVHAGDQVHVSFGQGRSNGASAQALSAAEATGPPRR